MKSREHRAKLCCDIIDVGLSECSKVDISESLCHIHIVGITQKPLDTSQHRPDGLQSGASPLACAEEREENTL